MCPAVKAELAESLPEAEWPRLYTPKFDVENYQRWPDIIEPDEPVWVTEKGRRRQRALRLAQRLPSMHRCRTVNERQQRTHALPQATFAGDRGPLFQPLSMSAARIERRRLRHL
jgi:hypothetical protein